MRIMLTVPTVSSNDNLEIGYFRQEESQGAHDARPAVPSQSGGFSGARSRGFSLGGHRLPSLYRKPVLDWTFLNPAESTVFFLEKILIHPHQRYRAVRTGAKA